MAPIYPAAILLKHQEEKQMIQTARLTLRELQDFDFGDLQELLQDPAVVYAYEHDFTNEDVRCWLDRQKGRYARYGFGLWAVILTQTGEWIGQAGLTMQPYEGEEVLEIGYLLKKRFWHRGYAREAAEAIRRYAFETLGARRVHAIIKTDNLPSIRVAEAIGMKREKTFTARYYHGDTPHYLYTVRRDTEAPVCSCDSNANRV